MEAEVAVCLMEYFEGVGWVMVRVMEAEEMADERKVLVPWRDRIGVMESERGLFRFHLPCRSLRVLWGGAAMVDRVAAAGVWQWCGSG